MARLVVELSLAHPRGPFFGPPLIRSSENSSHVRPSLFLSPWVVRMRELVFLAGATPWAEDASA